MASLRRTDERIAAAQLDRNMVSTLLADLEANRLALPTLPEFAMRVRKLAAHPDCSASQIVKVINTDPAMATRVLKMVNCPLYRGNAPITNLKTAVARLGSERLLYVVNVLALQQLYSGGDMSPRIKRQLQALWAHSANVAAYSIVLAERYTLLDKEQALLAGLVHDIGKLPVLFRLDALENAPQDEAQLSALLERLRPLLGPGILDAWGFAPDLIEVARIAEDAWGDDHDQASYADVVIVAHYHSLLGTPACLGRPSWENLPAFRKLGLTPEDSLAAMAAARDELAAARQLLMG